MPVTQTFTVAGLEWTIVPLDTDEQFEVECIFAQLAGPSLAAAVAALVQGLAPALVEVLRDTVMSPTDAIRVLAEAEARIAAMDLNATVDNEGDALVLLFDTVADADTARADLGELDEHLDLVDVDPATIRLEVSDDVLASDAEPFELSRIMDLDTADPRLRVAWERVLNALATTGGDLIRDAVIALVSQLDYRSVMRLTQLVLLGKHKTRVTIEGAGRPYVDTAKNLSKFLKRDPRAKWALLGRALLVTYGPDPVVDEPEDDGDA